ncbi:MAG: limonene-1,2-epoxide hydrolase family protein [Ilumatobacter sp.]|jgi:limonene-1,2-epoxide hydrolase|uniref:limonene-1,2-epoxide hydrolase family protein n=1 Tax=Ilumatobacter sp. TaxID=1967498 RepID=UPI00391C315B
MTPLETVNEFMRRFCDKDLDGACELVTADVEYDNVPIGKNFGPEGIKAFAGGMVDGFDTVEFIVHREAATGNVVLNERTDRFVRGDQQYDIPVVGVFELTDDGKIALWRDYFDMAPVQAMMAGLAG